MDKEQKLPIIKNSDLLMIFAMVAMIVFMVMPLPPFVMDFLLTFSLTVSLMILLVAMYTQEPLNFSVFPSLLLIITLFRLSLNVGATRLILLHGFAGQLVATFGEFVVGGNYVVGLVIFCILVVIQFVVITSGAQRVAEVAARFTLDAMPGKQMSIDADLTSGIINQQEAQGRRSKIEREADFYGAMDGAGKFIKGDAIASVVIIIINILGGIVVGCVQQGMPLVEAMKRYTLLTVGEGLITQIPALLVSTAMGIIVTRAASESNLGQDVTSQILQKPRILEILSALLFGFGFVPGIPKIPFFLFAVGTYLLSVQLNKEMKEMEEKPDPEVEEAGKPKEPGTIIPSLDLEPLEIELGYSLVPLVDEKAGGDLQNRVFMVRKACAQELGIVVPPVRIRDNIQINPRQYRIKMFGETVAEYEIMMGRLLAMGGDAGEDLMDEEIHGIETREPVFGLSAMWILEEDREKVEVLGYTVIDSSSIVATHLSEIIKMKAPLLLGRQETQDLISQVGEKYPALIKELMPQLSVGEIQKILQNLLSEGIPIKSLRQIMEVLADFSTRTKDIYYLTEQARVALTRTICQKYQLENGTIPVITLSMDVENMIRDAVAVDKNQPLAAIEPRRLKRFYEALLESMKKVSLMGYQPIILCSQTIRIYIKKLAEKVVPDLVVLSYNEILRETSIEAVDVLKMPATDVETLPTT